MNKNSSLTALIFWIIVSACHPEKVHEFSRVENLVDYESVFSDTAQPFNSVVQMAVVDSVLIAKHANDDYYFSFIDIKTGKMLRRWGKQGRGPEEYLQLGSGFTVQDSNLVFWDNTKKEMNYVSLSGLLRGDSLHILRQACPYTVDFRPMHIVPLRNRKIAAGAFKEGYFGMLDSAGHIIPNSFDYPFPYEGIEGIYRGTVYQTKIAPNDSLNRFVVQTLASDVFEIYQITGNEVTRLFVSPFESIPVADKNGPAYVLRTKKSVVGLQNLAVSTDYICFGYSSEIYAEAMKTGLASKEILCFDWKGNKVKKYLLPFPVNAFCFDRHYLYVVRYFNEASHILRFKLE